jgi:hypothetical protein
MSRDEFEAYQTKNKARGMWEPYSKPKRKPGTQPRHVAGQMNKTERRFYDEFIRPRISNKSLKNAKFEAIKLQLGDRCTYTPDFVCVTASGRWIAYEVKGSFTRDDAQVKLKTAAQTFPDIKFIKAIFTKEKKWNLQEIKTRSCL